MLVDKNTVRIAGLQLAPERVYHSQENLIITDEVLGKDGGLLVEGNLFLLHGPCYIGELYVAGVLYLGRDVDIHVSRMEAKKGIQLIDNDDNNELELLETFKIGLTD